MFLLLGDNAAAVVLLIPGDTTDVFLGETEERERRGGGDIDNIDAMGEVPWDVITGFDDVTTAFDDVTSTCLCIGTLGSDTDASVTLAAISLLVMVLIHLGLDSGFLVIPPLMGGVWLTAKEMVDFGEAAPPVVVLVLAVVTE